jgi:DNA-binding Xre family transcriptional regulator
VIENNFLAAQNLAMIRFHIGDVVRKLRERDAVKMRQCDLAEAIGSRTATISVLEKTGKFRPETIERIAKALGITVSEIYSLVPEDRDKPKPAPIADPTAMLCTDPDHRMLQQKLDETLHSEAVYQIGKSVIPIRDGVSINVICHHEKAIQSTSPPEGKHGSVRLGGLPGFGSIGERKKPIPKKSRN